ncbi:MAG: IclR family transcriptional regulator [Tropicimonas sp.]|uniref:IclR family transcriptional regulator n=1 Tax=Tropicimonas sp. TaxID=2067044 RepID=UPI003A8A0EBF
MPGRTIRSVERALSLLELVSEAPDGMSLARLAEKTGLNVSTCHHLAATLVGRGYLTQAGKYRGYTLGSKIREISEAAERASEPAVLLRDDLRALGEELGRGVQLAVLSDTALLTKLSFAPPAGGVTEADEVKKMVALHATATGKSILAWIPDTELVRIISANGLTVYTERTITTLSGLVEELRLVRRRKFAIDDEEFSKGIVCIGAAIRDGGGAAIAALSVTIPTAEASEEYRRFLCRRVVEATNQFSMKLRATSG